MCIEKYVTKVRNQIFRSKGKQWMTVCQIEKRSDQRDTQEVTTDDTKEPET